MKRLIFVFFPLLILGYGQQIYAATISVWPIELALHPDKNTENIRLTNKGNTLVNVQISAKTWDMDEAGGFIESDTGEFVFNPRLLKLPPGEEKLIRVGYQGKFPPIEQPFRIFIDELPPILPPEKQNNELGFTMKLSLSIPLFVMPSVKPPQPEIAVDGIEKSADGLKIGVKASGTHHVQVTRISAQLLGSEQKLLTSGEAKPTLLRILPKRRVFVDLPMDIKQCNQAQALQVSIEAKGLKSPYETQFNLNGIDCQPK